MFYTRYGNPTHTVAESAIAPTGGVDAALLFASGMNAITTSVLFPAEEWRPRRCPTRYLRRRHEILQPMLPARVETLSWTHRIRSARPRHPSDTKLLYLESPPTDAAGG